MLYSKEKRKIIFLGKLPPPYIGPAIAAKILLNSRLKDLYNLIHLDTSDHRSINTLGKVDVINFLIAFKLYWKLISLILRFRPEAIYIPSQQTTLGYLRDVPLILIARCRNCKVICHLRGGYFGNWYKEVNPIMKLVIEYVQKKIDAQIVLGQNLVPMFSNLMSEKKIYVVPNGGDYHFPDRARINNKVCVLFLANFKKSKGFIDFIKAAEYFNGTNNVEFICAGSWSENKTELEARDLLTLVPNVKIHGLVKDDEKLKLLVNSDIFVFPTYYRNEGHPWVIIEAMAAGLPIISTNHAAIPETVSDGINGFLVAKQNPQAIADKIKFLTENHEIRIAMGKESRRLYEEKFTEGKMVDNLKRVFETVLNQP